MYIQYATLYTKYEYTWYNYYNTTDIHKFLMVVQPRSKGKFFCFFALDFKSE
jgi:hypothetical protein